MGQELIKSIETVHKDLVLFSCGPVSLGSYFRLRCHEEVGSGGGGLGGQEYSFGGLVAVEGRGAAKILIRKVHGFVGWRGEETGREKFE